MTTLPETVNRLSLAHLRDHCLPAWADDNTRLTLHTSESIPAERFDSCFNLIAEGLKEMYARSSMDWKPGAKRREMQHPAMRFLVLETPGGDLVAFLSFMVTAEANSDCVYVYELHVVPSMQRKGVGERLMDVAEEFGRRVGTPKAFLTVFIENTGARRFYRRRGYEVDDVSPGPRKMRNGVVKEPDYEIMSKSL